MYGSSVASGRAAASFTPLLLTLMLLASCSQKAPEPAALPPPAAAEPSSQGAEAAPAGDTAPCDQRMQPLVAALWDKKPQGLEETLAVPVAVIHQQYEPSDADPPFVLGPAQSSTLNTPEDAAKLFAVLATRVTPQDGDLVPRFRESDDTSWDSTFVKEAGAGKMQRCALTMAVGDTEHVLIAGFDAASGKIAALYWN